MGKAIRASALILLLTCSARAGWMPNDTPQPPPQATQEATPNGQMEIPLLVQIVLSLLTLF